MANFGSSASGHQGDDGASSPLSIHESHDEDFCEDSHEEQEDDLQSDLQGAEVSKRACDQCRKGRTKCNHHGPCSACVGRSKPEGCSYTSKAMKRGPKEGWANWRNMQEVMIRDEPAIGDLLVARLTTQVVKNPDNDPNKAGKTCYQVGLESSTASRQYVNAGLGGTLFGMFGDLNLDPENPSTAAMLNTPWIRRLNQSFQSALQLANQERQAHIDNDPNNSPYDSPNPLAVEAYKVHKEREAAEKSAAASEADEPKTRRSTRTSKSTPVKKATRQSSRQSSGRGNTAKQPVADVAHQLTRPSGVQRRTRRNPGTSSNTPSLSESPIASRTAIRAVSYSSSPSSSQHDQDALVQSMADAKLVNPTQASFSASSQAVPAQMVPNQAMPLQSVTGHVPLNNQVISPDIRQLYLQLRQQQMQNPQSVERVGQNIMAALRTLTPIAPVPLAMANVPTTLTATTANPVGIDPSFQGQNYSQNPWDWFNRVPIMQTPTMPQGSLAEIGHGNSYPDELPQNDFDVEGFVHDLDKNDDLHGGMTTGYQ